MRASLYVVVHYEKKGDINVWPAHFDDAQCGVSNAGSYLIKNSASGASGRVSAIVTLIGVEWNQGNRRNEIGNLPFLPAGSRTGGRHPLSTATKDAKCREPPTFRLRSSVRSPQNSGRQSSPFEQLRLSLHSGACSTDGRENSHFSRLLP